MQRIALYFGLLVVPLVGCATPAGPSRGPLPDPLFATSTRPPTKHYTPRIHKSREVRRATQKPVKSVSPSAGWIPPGGIKKSRWNWIVVHHAASRKASPQSMHQYHLRRGWANGLGYHFVIGNGVGYPDGQVYVGQRWKRQQTGAHCKSSSGRYFGGWKKNNYFNEHGIGICLIGDLQRERPTAKQIASLERLIGFLCREAGIPPSHVHGHGEVTHKTACPGENLNMAALRSSVAQIYAGSR